MNFLKFIENFICFRKIKKISIIYGFTIADYYIRNGSSAEGNPQGGAD
jgi:hypothetical protein